MFFCKSGEEILKNIDFKTHGPKNKIILKIKTFKNKLVVYFVFSIYSPDHRTTTEVLNVGSRLIDYLHLLW